MPVPRETPQEMASTNYGSLKWIDLGFSFLEPSTIAWRFPIAFQIVLALFVAAGIPGLPESPRWLILKGREDEALEVLSALSDLPPEDPKIQSDFKAVKDAALEMASGSFSDCFKRNKNRNLHRTILGCECHTEITALSLKEYANIIADVNQTFQQISGINVIIFLLLSIPLSPKQIFVNLKANLFPEFRLLLTTLPPSSCVSVCPISSAVS